MNYEEIMCGNRSKKVFFLFFINPIWFVSKWEIFFVVNSCVQQKFVEFRKIL